MSLAAIHAAIPHREPFLLLDEIVEQSPEKIVCRKTFTGNEWFYQGHYPGAPLTPGVLLCEAALQAGAVLLSQQAKESAETTAKKVPVATRLNNVRFKRMVKPGETFEIEVTLTERLADAFFMTGKITVAGKTAVTLELACTMTAPE
jgi:3-hydroxyacyl-[acyl-carrier-protein] dehydratase